MGCRTTLTRRINGIEVMYMVRFLLSCLLLTTVLTMTALADIYKCVSEDGVTKYSDVPCAENAEVAFETASLNFDEVIGNASPYPKLPVPPSRVDVKDIIAHAKKIGSCIIPDEYNNTTIDRSSPMMPVWRIELHFGPADDEKMYVVEMEYGRKGTNKGLFVWLHSFTVKKDLKLYDAPSMRNVKTFKKMGTGRWEIRSD